jgi:hypothetical protein
MKGGLSKKGRTSRSRSQSNRVPTSSFLSSKYVSALSFGCVCGLLWLTNPSPPVLPRLDQFFPRPGETLAFGAKRRIVTPKQHLENVWLEEQGRTGTHKLPLLYTPLLLESVP